MQYMTHFVPDVADEVFINNLTTETANNFISTVQSLNKNYQIAITGTVGSGKSTLCETMAALCRTANITPNVYPEYLAGNNLALQLLEQKINGKISSLTLQSYVLDIWELRLRQEIHSNFSIFERCPDDSVLCFCNNDNAVDQLSDHDFLSLYRRMRKMLKKYPAPTYYSNVVHFTKIQSSTIDLNVSQITDIIKSDIQNNIYQRIIGLSVTPYLSLSRINKRNREGEKYTLDQATSYVRYYENLYETFEKKRNLNRFVDIGLL